MDHFVDLQLLPDPEFPASQLMNALFAKLHRALVAAQCEDIGMSYPGVHPKGLGTVLRLHGSQSRLAGLMASPWLQGMRDHVHASPVLPVPTTGVRYLVVSRVQAKSSPDRERRRLMRRQGLDAAQALARIPDTAAEVLDLPYLQVSSQSTAQKFRLFIRHGPLQDAPTQGTFTPYALSPTATIPWF